MYLYWSRHNSIKKPFEEFIQYQTGARKAYETESVSEWYTEESSEAEPSPKRKRRGGRTQAGFNVMLSQLEQGPLYLILEAMVPPDPTKFYDYRVLANIANKVTKQDRFNLLDDSAYPEAAKVNILTVLFEAFGTRQPKQRLLKIQQDGARARGDRISAEDVQAQYEEEEEDDGESTPRVKGHSLRDQAAASSGIPDYPKGAPPNRKYPLDWWNDHLQGVSDFRQDGYTAKQLRLKFTTFQSEYGKMKGGWKREFPQQIKLPGMNYTSKGRGVDYKCLNELLAMVAWNKFIQSGPEEWKDQLLPVATDEDDLTDLFREDFIQDGLDVDLQKYLGMQMWMHSTS